jgi:hypothetical protein
MKKILFLLIILFSFALLFGCTDPKEIALQNPKIKDFFEDYPSAKMTYFKEYSAYDVIDDKDFWKDCDEKVKADEYYKAVFEDNNIILTVLFDKGRIKLVCGILDNKLAAGSITKPDDEPDQEETNTPIECKQDIDCFISAASTCHKSFFTNEFGSEFEIKELKYDKCIVYKKDTNQDCPFEQSKLNQILGKWKNGIYKTSDFETCGDEVSEPLSPVCEENWTCGEWSECVADNQDRICIDAKTCETDTNKPIITQSCVVEVICEETWGCFEWDDCNNNVQTRECFLIEDCGYDSTEETSRTC